MKPNPVPSNGYQKAFELLEAARVLAGDLLFGVKDVAEVASCCREKGINKANIAIYILEQAGALPAISTNFNSDLQMRGAASVSALLANRYFQRSIAGYVFSLFDNKNSAWLSSFANLLAENHPSSFLYLLRYTPEPYELAAKPEIPALLKSLWIDGVDGKGRQAVAMKANELKRLPEVFRITGWSECLPGMKQGANRRALLAIDMSI